MIDVRALLMLVLLLPKTVLTVVKRAFFQIIQHYSSVCLQRHLLQLRKRTPAPMSLINTMLSFDSCRA
jgi:hypothetical protein